MIRGIATLLVLIIMALCGCGDSSHRGPEAVGLSNTALGNQPVSNPGNGQTTSGLLVDKNLPQGVLPNKRLTPIRKGSLLNKTLILSPGHGYFNDPGYWTTQRGVNFSLIEDIHTNEIAMDYLMPYITRAGGTVFSCRERSRQTNEVIVDNDQGAPSYQETGTWANSTSPGYQGKTCRYSYASTTESALATFRPNLPEAGFYPVYVQYRSSSNRAQDTRFRIEHTGGVTEIQIDQTKNDNRWLFLGEFYFEKGTQGSVVVSNLSSSAGKVVVADAVRFGGGVGPSGKPRWQECAQVFVPFIGAPLSQYGDVGIRGQYANWQGGDVFLSVHTNAAGGTGTSSYIHDTAPSAGSASYQQILHNQFIQDLRAQVDSTWKDRGKLTANFGELRNTTTMPAVLIELAFHDRQEDAVLLANEKIRNIMARALYKGILRYLAPGKPVSPLPPTHLMVTNESLGKVSLSWKGQNDPLETSANPKSYIVYTSINGKGFDNGVEVFGTSTSISNLTPGALYYFRVSALNDGGESFPGETLAIRLTPNGQSPKILVVSGFDRDDLKSTYLRNAKNTHNYTIQHGLSFARNGYFFDCVSNEAVEAGMVQLSGYKIVDWISGKESTQDKSFSSQEQTLIQAYLLGGGSLLVSGSEIAWHLGANGSTQDKDFLKNFLHAGYVKDSSQTYSSQGSVAQAFDGITSIAFDDGSHGIYDVDYPDVITAENGASISMSYTNGEGAAIQYSGTYKVIYMAFPLEAIYTDSIRDKMVDKAVEFLK